MIKIIIFSLILFFSSSFKEIDKSSKLDSQDEIIKNLVSPNLIGQYNLKVYGFNVYNIKLYSETDKFSYSKKFAIEITYKMNFSKENLVKRTIEEIARIQNISNKNELIVYEGEFNKIFLDVKKGDSKVAIFSPQKKVDIFLNHQLIGSIDDLKLARYFVDIWLSKNSSYPQMTLSILGEKND